MDSSVKMDKVPTFDQQSKARAGCILKAMRTSTFVVVGLVVLDEVLSPLLIPTKLLQGREVDVLKAYELIQETIQASIS